MTSQKRERRVARLTDLDDAAHAPGKRPANLRNLAVLLGFWAFGLACGPAAAATVSAFPAPQTATVAPAERVIEVGKATWYGRRHSKHYTVSGERFDPRRMTAAHRSIPIGTMVRVTDRSTGRSVVVKVNDREPPHGIRCIDLSEGAAKALGIRREGVADVVISALAPPAPAPVVEVAEAPEDAVAPGITALHGRRQLVHAGP